MQSKNNVNKVHYSNNYKKYVCDLSDSVAVIYIMSGDTHNIMRQRKKYIWQPLENFYDGQYTIQEYTKLYMFKTFDKKHFLK